jgi:hypothetical protein
MKRESKREGMVPIAILIFFPEGTGVMEPMVKIRVYGRK